MLPVAVHTCISKLSSYFQILVLSATLNNALVKCVFLRYGYYWISDIVNMWVIVLVRR